MFLVEKNIIVICSLLKFIYYHIVVERLLLFLKWSRRSIRSYNHQSHLSCFPSLHVSVHLHDFEWSADWQLTVKMKKQVCRLFFRSTISNARRRCWWWRYNATCRDTKDRSLIDSSNDMAKGGLTHTHTHFDYHKY